MEDCLGDVAGSEEGARGDIEGSTEKRHDGESWRTLKQGAGGLKGGLSCGDLGKCQKGESSDLKEGAWGLRHPWGRDLESWWAWGEAWFQRGHGSGSRTALTWSPPDHDRADMASRSRRSWLGLREAWAVSPSLGAVLVFEPPRASGCIHRPKLARSALSLTAPDLLPCILNMDSPSSKPSVRRDC